MFRAPPRPIGAGSGPYRTADPRSGFDEYVCPRCRYPVLVPSGETPRKMVCERDRWPLITLASFQHCDGDPIVGMELPGGFTPLEVVGAGSSAVVYRATVAPPSARRARSPAEGPPSSPLPFAAVKVMRLDGPDQASAMDAWEREVSALEKLRSPHLVRMLDSGRITHPASFFVALDWLEGDPLDAQGSPTLRDVIELAGDVATGLSALHARGFVHGDVKPRNAMRGARGATLFDLGSSFVEGARQHGFGDPLFRASPAFAAPERIEGGRIGRAADAYSLGATIFRLATGRGVFAGSAEEVARAQVDALAPAMREVISGADELAGRALDDPLWEPLEATVAALLTKDPSRRPTDPAALLRALRNHSMKVYGEEPNV
ncbi:MAG: serine/threonine-protein kinase [Polyangiaceae bacterium]